MFSIQIAEKAGVTVCLGSDMLASMVSLSDLAERERADRTCDQHPLQTNEVGRLIMRIWTFS